jgi:hypothetical protein
MLQQVTPSGDALPKPGCGAFYAYKGRPKPVEPAKPPAPAPKDAPAPPPEPPKPAPPKEAS